MRRREELILQKDDTTALPDNRLSDDLIWKEVIAGTTN